jgi:hypothetical protein
MGLIGWRSKLAFHSPVAGFLLQKQEFFIDTMRRPGEAFMVALGIDLTGKKLVQVLERDLTGGRAKKARSLAWKGSCSLQESQNHKEDHGFGFEGRLFRSGLPIRLGLGKKERGSPIRAAGSGLVGQDSLVMRS